jgi:hypothetical protein
MDKKKDEVEMFVAGLVMDPDSNAPIVILKDEHNDEGLPIWIGVSEASSIAAALKQVDLARPLTHDLLKNVIDEFQGRVLKVVIHDLEENTFIAAIEILSGEVVKRIDSRPSDAIALAIRVNAPIFVNQDVLEQAKIKIITDPEEESESDAKEPAVERDYSAEDRNFKTIDKDKWAKILEGMAPNDFKYKM